MARQELLSEAQGELIRSILRELVDGRELRQEDVAAQVGLSQQTISKAMNPKNNVGISVAVKLAEAGYLDLAAVLSNPPARWNGQVGTLERALVRIAFEKPYAAAAYTMAALKFRETPGSFIDKDPNSLTVNEVTQILRVMVGETPLLETPPENLNTKLLTGKTA